MVVWDKQSMSTDKTTSKDTRPSLLRNWLSLIGLVIAVGGLFSFLMLFAVDAMAGHSNPYVGILTYMVSPAFLFLGLFLTLLGTWRTRRKLAAAGTTWPPMVVNLSRPRDRRLMGGFILGGLGFLFLSALCSYQTYHFTESTTFCGEACHTVMEPERVRYQHSSHARVGCVECHIGPGAEWFVKAKISGTYQVYATAFNKYPTPVPTPIKNLRPAQDTCERCHWPQRFSGNITKTYRHFLSDKENTEYSIRLMLKVGGGDPKRHHEGGIHWHVNNKVEYLATDEQRLKIPWVRFTDDNGKVVEYRTKSFTNVVSEAEVRRMDCIDCHNRPSHRYQTPNEAVDLALAGGQLDRTLPLIRSNATALLVQPYATVAEAGEKISTALKTAYPGEPRVERAIATVQEIYRQNFFPLMKANWQAYPEHVGHKDWPGCFRCHDDKHVSGDGQKKIGFSDCNNCHVILAQGQGPELDNLSAAGKPFKHPGEDYDTAYLCNDCHTGGP